MSRQLAELEQTLAFLIVEHRKLLEQADLQQQAMRQMRAEQIEQVTRLQETTRLRIATLDIRRKNITQQLGRALKMKVSPTLVQLAEAFPQHGAALLHLRAQLRDLVLKIQARTSIASRLAGAVLGHLNTAVRVIAGAVEQAGIYTKNGTPRLAARIGAIEAVG